MSARTQLADKLGDALDKKSYLVIPAATIPDAPGKRAVVVVEFSHYEPAPNAIGNVITHLRVIVVSPKTDPVDAEDDLDNRLPDLITAINGVDGATWSRAEKTTVLDKKFPALTLTLTVPSSIDAT